MPPSPRSSTPKSAAKAPAVGPPEGGPRVVLLTGQEAGRKHAEALALVTKAVDPEFTDFDSEIMNGAVVTAERALSGVATVPLGVGKRVVLVRDTQQMEGEEQKRLAAGLPNIPASGYLILHTGAPVVEDGKTKKGSVVATELTNAVKKVGEVRDFGLPRADDVRTWLAQEAKRTWGKTLAPDALAILSQLPGDDLYRVGGELAKAASHAGDNPLISGADVEATLSRTPDDVIFKLCDAVGMRRTQEAMAHVSTLFKSGTRPESVAPRTLVLLARQIRLLAQFRYLGERKMAGRNAGPVSPEVMALLPGDGAGGMMTNPRMSWMADKYVAQARNFTGVELAERLEKILNADLALKGALPGGDNPQAVLQRIVIELC